MDVLATCSSDHAPITISLGAQQNRQGGRRGFCYEAGWRGNSLLKGILKKVWKVKEPARNAWQKVKRKLKESKKAILKWRRVTIDRT